MSSYSELRIRNMVAAAIAAPIVAAFGMAISEHLDSAAATMRLHKAESNHARFEGTWTPHEQRLANVRKEMAAFETAEKNHATAEGAGTIIV